MTSCSSQGVSIAAVRALVALKAMASSRTSTGMSLIIPDFAFFVVLSFLY